jgi:hypothetical protein
MPIVSKELRHIRPQIVGVRVTEVHTDSAGREWQYAYLAADEATATATMNARDLTEQLKDREEVDLVDFVTGGGDPDTFVRLELSVTEMRARLAKRFSRTQLKDRKQFLCSVASWVAGFSAGQIASALSISTALATKIRDRAIALRDTICPAMAADDAEIEDVG